MWLGLLLFIIIILVVLGGIVVGGFYAVVLLPIAAIILFGSLLITMWRRSSKVEARRGPAGSAGWPPPVNAPAGSGVNDAERPADPEELLEQRRD